MKQILWTEGAYESILRILAARTGLAFRADQRLATQEAIETCMRKAEFTDPDRFASALAYDADALDDLIGKLTVGETYFFREPDQFAAIRQEILPETQQRLGPQQRLRIWSAGCASGEEPYSCAMVCDQLGLADQCDILATDICSHALNKAKEASYREWSLRGEAARTAKQYLHVRDGRYLVDPRIVSLVRFELINLALDVYPSTVSGTSSLDLILCRNVLIYFDKRTIADVAQRLFRCLTPGGWLITASSDPSLEGFAEYETVLTPFGVFYRRPAARDLPRPSEPGDHSANSTSAQTTAARLQAGREPAEQSVSKPVSATRRQADRAASALARGEYVLAVELSEDCLTESAACAVHVKALANIDAAEAVRKCALFVERHPLVPELHYLHAVLLLATNLETAALEAAQRAIFIDRSLAIAHFLVGSILQRRGSHSGAARAFRNACDLCEERPPQEIVPLSEGETVGDLAKAARCHLQTNQLALRRNR